MWQEARKDVGTKRSDAKRAPKELDEDKERIGLGLASMAPNKGVFETEKESGKFSAVESSAETARK